MNSDFCPFKSLKDGKAVNCIQQTYKNTEREFPLFWGTEEFSLMPANASDYMMLSPSNILIQACSIILITANLYFAEANVKEFVCIYGYICVIDS